MFLIIGFYVIDKDFVQLLLKRLAYKVIVKGCDRGWSLQIIMGFHKVNNGLPLGSIIMLNADNQWPILIEIK